jgi:hypothetical protein
MDRRGFLKASAGSAALGALTITPASAQAPAAAATDSIAPIVEYDGWVMELQDKAAVQARELEVLRERIAELTHHEAASAACDGVRIELESTRSQLDAVLDSTSWKITEPLRSIVSRFR